MVGFVYSVAGLKQGQPIQWSHMLGVVAPYRGRGIARRLKLLQRERALVAGIDLIEWTFDPLQALNAHFNFNMLGGIVEESAANIYGASSSRLHGATPTDRLIVQWWLRRPHVERRLFSKGLVTLRDSGVGAATPANRVVRQGPAPACTAVDVSLDE